MIMVSWMQFHFHCVHICVLFSKRDKTQNKLAEVHCFVSNVIYIQFAMAVQFYFFLCCLFASAHFGCFCFLCQLFSGGCINASPAGKRRIANGIEQQQFGDDSLFGISGKLSIANDGNGNNGFGRITPATTAITAFAVAACVLIISVFAIVLVVIQVCTILPFVFFSLWKKFSLLFHFDHPSSKWVVQFTCDTIDSSLWRR